MTDPAAFDPETTPSVTLAGQQWPIPELVWRDLKKCRKELIELNGLVNAAIAASPAADGETEAQRAQRNMAVLTAAFDALSNEDFERLVMAVIHAGLAAAHPSLSKDEFFGWRLTEGERQMAWLVVRRQSGLFVFGDGDGEAAASGEAIGAA